MVEETGIPGENHRPVASHLQTLSHNVVSSTSCHEQDLNSQHFSGDSSLVSHNSSWSVRIFCSYHKILSDNFFSKFVSVMIFLVNL
jgi:hypothetical protein